MGKIQVMTVNFDPLPSKIMNSRPLSATRSNWAPGAHNGSFTCASIAIKAAWVAGPAVLRCSSQTPSACVVVSHLQMGPPTAEGSMRTAK